MAVPLTIEQFADLTDPRFREIVTGYEDAGPDFIEKFYTQEDATQETERGSYLTPMGNHLKFTGVGQLTYDGPDQGYDWSATNVEYALGLQIQRRLWEWDQFNVIEEQWEALRDSAFETKQTHAIQMLNDGFDTSSLLNFEHSRGEALFADSHTTPRGDVSTSTGFDNKYNQALSKTALKTVRINARKFKDDAGRVRGINLDTLIIPPDLEYTAEELVQSTLDPESAENAVNVNKGHFNIVVVDRLDDTNDWFAVNMDRFKRNNKWFWKVRGEFSRVLDFETHVAKYSSYMSYTIAWRDWRVGIGASVS